MPSLVNHLYEFGEFRLDPQKRTLQHGEEFVALTPKAFDTLLVLVENAGQLIRKDDLMKTVWADSFVEESNLTQTVFMLRKALGQTRDQGYIVTVPGHGYRFAADVKPVSPAVPQEPETPAAIRPADVRVKQSRLRWPISIAIAGVLLLTGAAAFHRLRSRPQPAGRTMLAVLPFQNLTGDPSQEYFSDGMTEEMISQLGNLDPQHLGVIARTSVMLYKSNPKPLDQVGRELGIQYALEGSVRREAQRLRITAQLIEIKDQTHLWAHNYDRSANDLLAVQQEITQEIAEELKLTLDSAHATTHRATAAQNISYETYDLYLKGRYFWSKRTSEGFRQAAENFQQAITQDPSFARAYAGLADTYALMSTWDQGPANDLMPKARAAALRAIALDDSLAEPHASLALVAENYDYDMQTAEKEFRRAIQLDPSYATAHQWYAEYLSWQGRFDEALAESERARQLDPLSQIIATDHGSILYFARRYDQAIAQCRSVLDMDASFHRARGLLIRSYVQSGKFEEAIHEVDAWTNATWTLPWKVFVYGRWGRTAQAEQTLAKFERLLPQYVGDPDLLLLVARLGMDRKDQAITLLEKLYAEHSPVIVTLKTDPIFDPLRTDPRFQQLLSRVGSGITPTEHGKP